MSGYVYAGGISTNKVRKYLKSDLSLVAEGPDYGGYVYGIAVGPNHVYAGGVSTNKVHKYLKSDLSLVTEGPSYGGEIYALAEDKDYVYAGGATTNKVRKYLKSDLSFVAESPDYGGAIWALVEDADYVYAGGTTRKVRKYLKSDMSFVAESPDYGGTIWVLAEDAGYVYAGGFTPNKVRKYLKSDLSFVAESPDYGGNIWGLAAEDADHVYAGGYSTLKVRKYLKSDMSFVAESPSYGGSIWTLAEDAEYVYAGGSANRIRRYLKSDMSYIDQSPSYGGGIIVLAEDRSGFGELHAGFDVGQNSVEFKAVFRLRQEIIQLKTTAVVRHTVTQNLSAEFNVIHILNLSAEFVVRHSVPAWRITDQQICTITPYDAWTPDPLGRQQQRHSFIAHGLHWLFYHSYPDILYRTSPHGIVWSPPQVVRSSNSRAGEYFALCFDGTYVHYAYGGISGDDLCYRRGRPEADGSITWSAVEQIATAAAASWSWRYPVIAVDENGYPFIFYDTLYGASYRTPKVTKSSRNDGIWATEAGFPWTPISTNYLWYGVLTPLPGGRMYLLIARYDTDLAGKLWSGSSWSSESIGGGLRVTAITEGTTIHAVYYRSDTDKAYYRKRIDGSGWSAPVEIYSTSSTNAPIISIDEEGTLYVWWEESDSLYLLKCIGGVWETTPTIYEGVPTIPYQQQDAPAQYPSHIAFCLAYGSTNASTWLRHLVAEYWAPELRATFAVGQDSINLKASFRLTQEVLPAEFEIRQSSSRDHLAVFIVRHSAVQGLFSEMGVAHWKELRAKFWVYKIYDLSHADGLAFYWWGSDVVDGDQMIGFQMWSPRGGWYTKFPDGEAGWRWVFLSFKEGEGDAFLREFDLVGSRPDRSQIVAMLWTYYTEGLRRLAMITAWRRQELKSHFTVRQSPAPRTLPGLMIVRHGAVGAVFAEFRIS